MAREEGWEWGVEGMGNGKHDDIKLINPLRSKLPSSTGSIDTFNPITYAIWGKRRVRDRHNNTFTRLASLEARGSKRAGLSQSLYLPVIFFAYAFLLGELL